MIAAFLGRETGVIRPGLDAVFAQALRHAFGRLARQAIHDAAFLRPAAEKIQQLIVGLVFGEDAVGEIGPVEAGHVTFRLVQL